MDPIRVDDFNLNASWSCYARSHSAGGFSLWQSEAKVTKKVVFSYELPKNTVIKSARVHSLWSGSLFGIDAKTVNGVEPDEDGFVAVDPADATETALEVEFFFKATQHGNSYTEMVNEHWAVEGALESGRDDVTYTVGSHTSSAKVSDVYLLLEIESAGGVVHRAEGGKLVPYRLCRAEGGKLVPYRLCRAESGKLVPY